jgi:hypothetical protein
MHSPLARQLLMSLRSKLLQTSSLPLLYIFKRQTRLVVDGIGVLPFRLTTFLEVVKQDQLDYG